MKTSLKFACMAILLLCLSQAAFAWGRAEESKKKTDTTVFQSGTSADWNTAATGQTVQVIGRIRLVGSAPLTTLVISDAAGNDWYIAETDREAVRLFEQREITLTGLVEIKEMILANGTKLPSRRILSKIVVQQ